MTDLEIRIALAELQGISGPWMKTSQEDGYSDGKVMLRKLTLDWLHEIEKTMPRVKWVNTLREVVGRTMPKNKAGTAIVSDVDLLLSTKHQRAEAILRTLGKWREGCIK